MGKENSKSKNVRIVAAILGLVSFFLAWEAIGFGLGTITVSLLGIMSVTQEPLVLLGGVAFVIGTIILFFHPVGVLGQILGLVIVGGSLLSIMAENSNVSFGMGFHIALASCIIAGVGWLHGWAWSGTPSA